MLCAIYLFIITILYEIYRIYSFHRVAYVSKLSSLTVDLNNYNYFTLMSHRKGNNYNRNSLKHKS